MTKQTIVLTICLIAICGFSYGNPISSIKDLFKKGKPAIKTCKDGCKFVKGLAGFKDYKLCMMKCQAAGVKKFFGGIYNDFMGWMHTHIGPVLPPFSDHVYDKIYEIVTGHKLPKNQRNLEQARTCQDGCLIAKGQGNWDLYGMCMKNCLTSNTKQLPKAKRNLGADMSCHKGCQETTWSAKRKR